MDGAGAAVIGCLVKLGSARSQKVVSLSSTETLQEAATCYMELKKVYNPLILAVELTNSYLCLQLLVLRWSSLSCGFYGCLSKPKCAHLEPKLQPANITTTSFPAHHAPPVCVILKIIIAYGPLRTEYVVLGHKSVPDHS